MFIRQAARSVAIIAAAGASVGLGLLAFTAPAGADIPNNSSVPAAQAQVPFTPGTPFASGQTITVAIGPNSLFTNLENVHIVECAAGPGGTVPTGTPVCDNNTQYGSTNTPAANGSFSVNDFPVYALPSNALGEGASNPVHCGDAVHECILYIGLDQSSTGPNHIWSQAFQVHVTSADEGLVGPPINPGDGTPEVPLAIGLPLAAAGLIGGTVAMKRRKAARAAA